MSKGCTNRQTVLLITDLLRSMHKGGQQIDKQFLPLANYRGIVKLLYRICALYIPCRSNSFGQLFNSSKATDQFWRMTNVEFAVQMVMPNGQMQVQKGVMRGTLHVHSEGAHHNEFADLALQSLSGTMWSERLCRHLVVQCHLRLTFEFPWFCSDSTGNGHSKGDVGECV